MDKVSLILSALMSLAILFFLAPGVLAMNRGKILRNIALWVAIFLGLALIYRHVIEPRQTGTVPMQEDSITLQESAPEPEDMDSLKARAN